MERPLSATRQVGQFLSQNETEPAAFWLDLTGMGVAADIEVDEAEEALVNSALEAMRSLEAGSEANPDEHRQVGHYWLRDPALAPTPVQAEAIRSSWVQIEQFCQENAGRFSALLLIGIGGSALGPQLLADALRDRTAPGLEPFFLDNTDPDGMQDVFDRLAQRPGGLEKTLVVVVSKSGGTQETYNGQQETRAFFQRSGVDFPSHAVAVTLAGSRLAQQAHAERWLAIFPLWDWVGGRTSLASVVGLLPGRLMGIPMDAFLQGAREMDACTRIQAWRNNPAMLMALAWLRQTRRGLREMVVLPYRDRLALMPKYLQQLVMESLGKEMDLQGRIVQEGIVVYGNKGSTDQHAYVQQLRDGAPTGFVLFLHVLCDRETATPPIWIEPQVTSGDYLFGFLMGTQRALADKGRPQGMITLPQLTPYWLGALIALFERAVGYYAALVGINAYHQPGVEAGKKAAGYVIALQKKLLAVLSDLPQNCDQLTACVGLPQDRDTVFWVLERLAAHGRIRRTPSSPTAPTVYVRIPGA